MVQGGDSIFQNLTARKFNDFSQVADAFREGRLQTLGGSNSGRPVLIENDSGEKLDAHSILGISGAAVGPADDENQFRFNPVLKGITPVATTHSAKFAVLLQPADQGAIVEAQVAGFAVAKVNINSTSDEFADVKNADNTQLESGKSGCPIIPVESGTGTKWCIVLLGGLPTNKLYRFTLNENMGATTSGQADADLLLLDGTDTGEDVDVLDPIGMFSGIVNGTNGYCILSSGVYYAIQAECAGEPPNLEADLLTYHAYGVF